MSLVGGGGKSTLLFALGNELAAAGKRVILTTTTKLGTDQVVAVPTICWSADTDCAMEALDKPGPVMLLTYADDHKVTGPTPDSIDRLFLQSNADYIVVEADGSKGRPLKAPANHEPVIPHASTTVVILMGISAVGRHLQDVTHRVEQAMRFTMLPPDRILTPEDCARILLHPDGALRVCPPQSRVLVAISQVSNAVGASNAAAVRREVLQHPQITDCVVV